MPPDANHGAGLLGFMTGTFFGINVEDDYSTMEHLGIGNHGHINPFMQLQNPGFLIKPPGGVNFWDFSFFSI